MFVRFRGNYLKLKIAFYFICILLLSCTGTAMEKNKLDSDDYETAAQRVKALRKVITAPSDFTDAEFELFNVNGFGDQQPGVAGASSWDYKFVVRADTADLSKWIMGAQPMEIKGFDNGWITEIVKNREQNWNMASSPKYYVKDGVTTVIFEKEGIVCKRVFNL